MHDFRFLIFIAVKVGWGGIDYGYNYQLKILRIYCSFIIYLCRIQQYYVLSINLWWLVSQYLCWTVEAPLQCYFFHCCHLANYIISLKISDLQVDSNEITVINWNNRYSFFLWIPTFPVGEWKHFMRVRQVTTPNCPFSLDKLLRTASFFLKFVNIYLKCLWP